MDLHNFNILIHKAVLCTQNSSSLGKIPSGKGSEQYWVAEKRKASGYKRRYVTLLTKQNTEKKVAKYLRTGIYLIVAPGEAIYVPTSHVGFMCLLVCYSI